MILRKITQNGKGIEMNFDLGDSYTLITKERNPDFFETYTPIHPDECFGYISYSCGKIIELYNTQMNYIMSENGQTFSYIKG